MDEGRDPVVSGDVEAGEGTPLLPGRQETKGEEGTDSRSPSRSSKRSSSVRSSLYSDGGTSEGTGTNSKRKNKHIRNFDKLRAMLHKQLLEDDELFPSTGLKSSEAKERLKMYGENTLEKKQLNFVIRFLLQFCHPVPALVFMGMWVEYWLGSYTDFYVLCFLQTANAVIAFTEKNAAAAGARRVKRQMEERAIVKRDGKWLDVRAWQLVPGDLVKLEAGQIVPADCWLNEGRVLVNEAALTGHLAPVAMHAGGELQPRRGARIVSGKTEGTVMLTGHRTFAGQTMNLVSEVFEMANLQKILYKVLAMMLATSISIVLIIYLYLVSVSMNELEAIEFVVVILIGSIPIAMEVVITVTMEIGSRQLAKAGAVINRLSATEELARMNTLCWDKTGTLTKLEIELLPDAVLLEKGVGRDELVLLAQLCTRWSEPAHDPVAHMLLELPEGDPRADLATCDDYMQTRFSPYDPDTKRSEAELKGPDGKRFGVTLGGLDVMLDVCENGEALREKLEEQVAALEREGVRVTAVGRCELGGAGGLGSWRLGRRQRRAELVQKVQEAAGTPPAERRAAKGLAAEPHKWRLVGLLPYVDPARETAPAAVKDVHDHGVGQKLLTEDTEVIAKHLAGEVHLGQNLRDCRHVPHLKGGHKLPKTKELEALKKEFHDCDGYFQAGPEQKVVLIEALRKTGGLVVGMVGDGINDSTALKRADVGIAVSGAVEGARACADIFLTDPSLMTIPEVIEISRKFFERVKAFLTYKLTQMIQVLLFFLFAIPFVEPVDWNSRYDDYVSLPALALVLIALLNDCTIITIAYDYVTLSKMPVDWGLPIMYVSALVMGSFNTGASLLMLVMCLNSGTDSSSLLAQMGITLSYRQTMTAMYLELSISSFLSLFAVRTHGFAWSRRPGNALLCACIIASCMASWLSYWWPFTSGDDAHMKPIGWGAIAFVWCYAWFWFHVQDCVKVLAYKLMHKVNLFGINDLHAGYEVGEDGGYHDDGADESKVEEEESPSPKNPFLKGLVPFFGSTSQKKGAVVDEETKEGRPEADEEQPDGIGS